MQKDLALFLLVAGYELGLDDTPSPSFAIPSWIPQWQERPLSPSLSEIAMHGRSSFKEDTLEFHELMGAAVLRPAILISNRLQLTMLYVGTILQENEPTAASLMEDSSSGNSSTEGPLDESYMLLTPQGPVIGTRPTARMRSWRTVHARAPEDGEICCLLGRNLPLLVLQPVSGEMNCFAIKSLLPLNELYGEDDLEDGKHISALEPIRITIV